MLEVDLQTHAGGWRHNRLEMSPFSHVKFCRMMMAV